MISFYRIIITILALVFITTLSFPTQTHLSETYQEAPTDTHEPNFYFMKCLFGNEHALLNIILDNVDSNKLIDTIEALPKNKDYMNIFEDPHTWTNHPITTIKQLNRLITLQPIIREKINTETFTFGVTEVLIKQNNPKWSAILLEDRHITFISESLPSLENLIIQKCRNTTSDVLQMISGRNKLKVLELEECLLDESLGALLEAVPDSIQKLCIYKNSFNLNTNNIEYLSNLEQLKELNLTSCKLAGLWHRCISSLPINLESLVLDSTDYQGENADIMQDLQNLSNLSLYYCRLTKEWKNLIPHLPESLEILNLNWSDYAGEEAHQFQKLKSLRMLLLPKCKLREAWDKLIPNLPDSLEALELNSSDYQGQQADKLQNLHRLSTLLLHQCNLGENWNYLIPNLPKTLKKLDLSWTDYHGQQVETIYRLEMLRILQLPRCNLGYTWNNLLLNITDKLEHLNIESTDYQGQEITAISRLHMLKTFNLGVCNLDDRLYEKLIINIPASLEVIVVHCSQALKQKLSKSRPELKYTLAGYKNRP